MSTGWMRSFQCKSKASDDVVPQPNPKNHRHHNSASCKNSVQRIKDVVETTKPSKPKKPKPPKPHHAPPFRRPVSRKPVPGLIPPPAVGTRPIAADSCFSTLAELPKGHPSRNVVEIIFHTSWGEKNFSGQVEMVFKVQNLNRTLTRFEEYREDVKYRASCAAAAGGKACDDHARCAADGNEVMRFYCLGPAVAYGGACGNDGGAWAFNGGKKGAACTFSGSGVAHENAGGGRGRRTMLVCRVIAGRVCKKLGVDSVIQGRICYDSVGGENGELFVFDTRALLPCFLIIYKL